MSFQRVLVCVSLWTLTAALSDVADLHGNAEFRSMKLHWTLDKREKEKNLSGFLIRYCEDQSWGTYRCKKRTFPYNFVKETPSEEDNNLLEYEAMLDRLRMATNYSVEVSPIFAGEKRASSGRAINTNIKLRTKGFSAHAINCFSNSSLVEVATGPYFGGRVSVEGSTDPSCSVQGDPKSSKSSYMLVIDHKICGSEVNNASVTSYVIVQENLPILTHSTRRFVILCSYLPETFTVRAGVNLPGNLLEDRFNTLVPVGEDVVEVDPSELYSSNSIPSSTLFGGQLKRNNRVGKALRRTSELSHKKPEKWAHLILMVVLVMVAVVGLSCAVWQLVWHSRKRRKGGILVEDEPTSLHLNDSIEAAVRDFTQDLNAACPSSNQILSPVPDALVSVVEDCDKEKGEKESSGEGFLNEACDTQLENQEKENILAA